MRVKFLSFWAFFVALKLILAIFLQPLGDEAFYWWEGQHPAWAYSDLPGLTAWLTQLGTAMAGNHGFGLRWPFIVISACLPWQIVRIAKQLGHSDNDSWQAGLLALPIPLLLPMGIMALPDALLTCAFLLCVEASLLLRQTVSYRACAMLTIGLSIGALTHYRFAPLLLGGALGILLTGSYVRWRDWRLLLALAIGAAAWLPLISYNLDMFSDADSRNAGVQFQLFDRHPWSFNVLGFLQPIAQALVISPILYGLCVWALWQCARTWWRDRCSAYGLLLGACGLPFFLYFLLAPFSDQARTNFHWSIQACLPLVAALPALLKQQLSVAKATRWLHSAFALALLLSVIVSLWLAAAASTTLTQRLAGSKLAVDNLVGWNEIAAAVSVRASHREILVADNFMLAAQLALALNRPRDFYVLDHPLNHKHGRAKQISDWQYDEQALRKQEPNGDVLLILERQASKPSQWPAWRDRLCTLSHAIRREEVVAAPGQPYRFLIYRAKLGVGSDPCTVEDAPVPR